MKMRICRKQREGGSALVGTLIAILVVGTVVASYVGLVTSANRSAYRSEAWNAALVAAEAGVEEAMAHLQRNYPSNLVQSPVWQLDGTNVVCTRQVGQGTYTVRASLDTHPVVTSSGTVRLGGEDVFLTRTLQVVTAQTGMIRFAFASKLDIKMNGNNVSTDSYDSTDPNHSTTNGRYDPAKAKDGGDVNTNLGTDWAFDAGNAVIRGKVATGPDGSVDLGPGAVIGSAEWHAAGNTGAQEGWVRDNSNVLMPDVEVPFTSGYFTPSGGNFENTNYTVVLGSDIYQMNKLAGKVLVTGDATLLVKDQVNISGQDYIRILPGASLKLYVAAKTASIGGLGVINESSHPERFSYYGLPQNKTVSVGGNGQFAGVIYAPNTDVQLNGGGHVYGAIVSRTISMNGGFQFHYDEALNANKAFQWFRIMSWEEI